MRKRKEVFNDSGFSNSVVDYAIFLNDESQQEKGLGETRIGSGNILSFGCHIDSLISATGAQGRIYPGYMTFEVISI